jgi:hypothetical protein
MGYVGHVFFVSLDMQIQAAAAEVFLRELERSIDFRSDDDRICATYHVGRFQSLSLDHYKRLAALLKPRKQKLQKTTSSLALCTRSPFARAALKTVLSVATLPYPTAVFEKMSNALAFQQDILPAVRVMATLAEYREVIGDHLPGLLSDLETAIAA